MSNFVGDVLVDILPVDEHCNQDSIANSNIGIYYFCSCRFVFVHHRMLNTESFFFFLP